jgi:hypothetical protein
MTQNSDSGDAVGDAGPTNRQAGIMSAQGEKSLYEIGFQVGKFCLFNRGLTHRSAAAKPLELDANDSLRDDRPQMPEGN